MSYGAPPPPPPPPGFPPGPGMGYGGYPVASKTSGKAIWALVCGILSIFCCGIVTGVVAIVLGNIARREIDASNGRLTGRGMATAGFVLGIVGTVLMVLGVIVVLATGSHS